MIVTPISSTYKVSVRFDRVSLMSPKGERIKCESVEDAFATKKILEEKGILV